MIIPAILPKSVSQLRRQMSQVKCPVLHIDLMDGSFVHHKTIKPVSIPDKSRFVVHMMVDDPVRYLPELRGVRRVISQIEPIKDFDAFLRAAKSDKLKVGVAINPRTPLKKVLPFIKRVDYVLIMSVNPGKQGQPFQPSALKKVRVLRRRFPRLRIGMDGGIRDGTAQLALKAGVSDLIIGSAIFGQPDPQKAFLALKARLA